MTFMMAYLKSGGHPAWHISIFWTAIGVSSMAASWRWPLLLFGARNNVAFSTLVGIKGFESAIPLLIPLSGRDQLAAVFGSTFLAVVATTSEFVRRQVDVTQHIAAIGTCTLAFGVGQTLGPLTIGLFTNRIASLRSGLVMSTVLISAGAMLAIQQRTGQTSLCNERAVGEPTEDQYPDRECVGLVWLPDPSDRVRDLVVEGFHAGRTFYGIADLSDDLDLRDLHWR